MAVEVATDQPRSKPVIWKPVTPGPYEHTGSYGYGSYLGEDDDRDPIEYRMKAGDIDEAGERGVTMRCNICDKIIDEPGWWRQKGAREVPVCNTCWDADAQITRKLLDDPLSEIPESTQVWVSDLVDVITHTIVTILDSIEADHRNVVIQSIEGVLDEYDLKGFRKDPK